MHVIILMIEEYIGADIVPPSTTITTCTTYCTIESIVPVIISVSCSKLHSYHLKSVNQQLDQLYCY